MICEPRQTAAFNSANPTAQTGVRKYEKNFKVPRRRRDRSFRAQSWPALKCLDEAAHGRCALQLAQGTFRVEEASSRGQNLLASNLHSTTRNVLKRIPTAASRPAFAAGTAVDGLV
jgi:hypothetical protein